MKILVADDEKHILRIIQFNLEKEGFTVFTAGDGELAMQIVEREKPDIVILDIMMPRKTGFEICGEIREKFGSDIKIILLSAKGQKTDLARGEDCGADIYMTKPFSPRILLQTIKNLDEGKQ